VDMGEAGGNFRDEAPEVGECTRGVRHGEGGDKEDGSSGGSIQGSRRRQQSSSSSDTLSELMDDSAVRWVWDSESDSAPLSRHGRVCVWFVLILE